MHIQMHAHILYIYVDMHKLKWRGGVEASCCAEAWRHDVVA